MFTIYFVSFMFKYNLLLSNKLLEGHTVILWISLHGRRELYQLVNTYKLLINTT